MAARLAAGMRFASAFSAKTARRSRMYRRIWPLSLGRSPISRWYDLMISSSVSRGSFSILSVYHLTETNLMDFERQNSSREV